MKTDTNHKYRRALHKIVPPFKTLNFSAPYLGNVKETIKVWKELENTKKISLIESNRFKVAVS
jgi:hypothetical protein